MMMMSQREKKGERRLNTVTVTDIKRGLCLLMHAIIIHTIHTICIYFPNMGVLSHKKPNLI